RRAALCAGFAGDDTGSVPMAAAATGLNQTCHAAVAAAGQCSQRAGGGDDHLVVLQIDLAAGGVRNGRRLDYAVAAAAGCQFQNRTRPADGDRCCTEQVRLKLKGSAEGVIAQRVGDDANPAGESIGGTLKNKRSLAAMRERAASVESAWIRHGVWMDRACAVASLGGNRPAVGGDGHRTRGHGEWRAEAQRSAVDRNRRRAGGSAQRRIVIGVVTRGIADRQAAHVYRTGFVEFPSTAAGALN